jgi:hypothetical protein
LRRADRGAVVLAQVHAAADGVGGDGGDLGLQRRADRADAARRALEHQGGGGDVQLGVARTVAVHDGRAGDAHAAGTGGDGFHGHHAAGVDRDVAAAGDAGHRMVLRQRHVAGRQQVDALGGAVDGHVAVQQQVAARVQAEVAAGALDVAVQVEIGGRAARFHQHVARAGDGAGRVTGDGADGRAQHERAEAGDAGQRAIHLLGGDALAAIHGHAVDRDGGRGAQGERSGFLHEQPVARTGAGGAEQCHLGLQVHRVGANRGALQAQLAGIHVRRGDAGVASDGAAGRDGHVAPGALPCQRTGQAIGVAARVHQAQRGGQSGLHPQRACVGARHGAVGHDEIAAGGSQVQRLARGIRREHRGRGGVQLTAGHHADVPAGAGDRRRDAHRAAGVQPQVAGRVDGLRRR